MPGEDAGRSDCRQAPPKIPAGEAFCRYEAPRGEDVHYVRGNGTEKPERVKVRAPTMANLQGVKTMLQNYNLADVSIVLAAIDPCFSCTDRMVAVYEPGGELPGSHGYAGLARLEHRGISASRRGLHRVECSALT